MLIFLLILINPCIARRKRKEIENERLCCANISVRNKSRIYEYSFTGIIFMQKDIDIFLRIQYLSTQINLHLKADCNAFSDWSRFRHKVRTFGRLIDIMYFFNLSSFKQFGKLRIKFIHFWNSRNSLYIK